MVDGVVWWRGESYEDEEEGVKAVVKTTWDCNWDVMTLVEVGELG